MQKLHYLAFVGCLFLVSCHSINQYFGLEDDNIIEDNLENIVESFVQYETGFDRDWETNAR